MPSVEKSAITNSIEVLKYSDQDRFYAIFQTIGEELHAWRAVIVFLTGRTDHSIVYIARRLKELFRTHRGIILICSGTEILVLVKLEANDDSPGLAKRVGEALPRFSCRTAASNLTPAVLFKIHTRLAELNEAEMEDPATILYMKRLQRTESLVLVADDDEFMRSLVANVFKDKCRVMECGDAASIVDRYLEHLPDVVFLDIHMPHVEGTDILSEILAFDSTAYIIMITSDSVRHKVIGCREKGARGFIAKPFTQGKLLECYRRCPTVAARMKKKG
jgi:two-component system, chemotaxis family, chemotaxis protein CheY